MAGGGEAQPLPEYSSTAPIVRFSRSSSKETVFSCTYNIRQMCLVESTEETRVERKQRECLCPFSWSVHHANLARDVYIESTCCCVQSRFLGMGTQRFYTGFWHGLALMINITKCEEQRQLQGTVACNWAFFPKPWVLQALLSFHHSTKLAKSHLFSS